jgi:serine-type D-Ala-D-Ala carboxypeptidase (penicillin-binding protein 5/6)
MTYRVLSLGLILLATGPTWAEEELPEGITARAWAIADGRTGELLWGLNEDKPAKAASTTKMMCAWVVLRLAEADPGVWDQTVTYSKFAAATTGSSSRLREGESVSVAECLYGLLLPSGNDAGNALAEHFNDMLEPPTGDMPKTTRSNFLAEMNRWAERLEMTRTVYRSPYGDGGTAEEFTTTPRDLLRLAHRAMQDERFRQYVGTRRHSTLVTTPDGGQREVTWTNTNQLLGDEGFDGIKTGTTTSAGACLVSSGRRGDDHLLVVVLGSSSSQARYSDTKSLFEWAWARRP